MLRNGRKIHFAKPVFKFLNDTSSIIVSGSAFLSVFVMQDKFTFVMLLCALANAVFGKILKLITAQARPSTSKKRDRTYGMPSSHANSLFYFVTFLTIATFMEYGFWYSLLIGSLLFTYTMIVLYCRVEIDRDHTWSQVFVGGIIGLLVGVFTILYIIPSDYIDVYISCLNYKYYLRLIGQKPEVLTMGIGLILLQSGQKFIEIESTLQKEEEEEVEEEVEEEGINDNETNDWFQVWTWLGSFSVCDGTYDSSESNSIDVDNNLGYYPKVKRSLVATSNGRLKHVINEYNRYNSKQRLNQKSGKHKSGKQIVQEAHAGWCNDITNILFCCCFCKPHSFVEGIIDDDDEDDGGSIQ